jgi:hypothetical protein
VLAQLEDSVLDVLEVHLHPEFSFSKNTRFAWSAL